MRERRDDAGAKKNERRNDDGPHHAYDRESA